MFFSSLNNSETIRVKNSFYLKCVYLMCLVLNSAPCACILVVYVDTHRSNLWGISFEMHILDTCIKLKKLISCSFWFSVAGDQTQCLTHGIQVPYPWGIIPTLESLWKDFSLKKKKTKTGLGTWVPLVLNGYILVCILTLFIQDSAVLCLWTIINWFFFYFGK